MTNPGKQEVEATSQEGLQAECTRVVQRAETQVENQSPEGLKERMEGQGQLGNDTWAKKRN